jgi:hypothetical protein
MCNCILIVLSSLHHYQLGLTIEEPDKIMLYSEVTDVAVSFESGFYRILVRYVIFSVTRHYQNLVHRTDCSV